MTYTKQQTFNKVVRHLRKQGAKSVDVMGCAYRGHNGRSCAVGCLISDEYYNSKMEGKGAAHDNVRWALGEHYIPLLSELQRVHDDVDVSDWEFGFDCVALKHGLRVPE